MTTATEADARIRASLEAGPQAWSYDSNDTPFYNDENGRSRGGDPDGTYCLFGEAFEIDGELYDGPVLSERCSKADAMFISACAPEALRALLTERAELLAKVSLYREYFEADQEVCKVFDEVSPGLTSPPGSDHYERQGKAIARLSNARAAIAAQEKQG